VVVSPLLYLADFFLPPLSIQSEVAVQLVIADEELVIEGKIDILVLHNRLWLLLIESKRAAASLEVGLPQRKRSRGAIYITRTLRAVTFLEGAGYG
jgi:hypothetical protein